jgi:hypothetical protein
MIPVDTIAFLNTTVKAAKYVSEIGVVKGPNFPLNSIILDNIV